MNLYALLFGQECKEMATESVARRDWLKTFGLAGRLSSLPEARLQSPANRQTGKPAPRCLLPNRRSSTSGLGVIVLHSHPGKCLSSASRATAASAALNP